MKAKRKGNRVKGFLKIDLQLFAAPEDPGEGGTPPANPPGDKGTGEPGANPPGKTYTQEQIDEMITKRLKRAKESALNEYKKTDEYKQFEKFLKDNQTSEEKQKEINDQLNNFKTENEDLKRQLQDHNNINILRDKNIDPKYHKFLNFEVKQSQEDGQEFADALDKYLEANPGYVGETSKGMTTGKRNTGGTGGDDLDELRKAMGVYKRPTN